MAQLNGFNADEHQDPGFDPLPQGQYRAAVIDSEFKTTKAGDGQYLSLKIQVIDGEFKGRTLFENLSLDHKSQEAAKIARSKLASLCRAVGVNQPKDSSELHDIPMLMEVTVRKREDNGEFTNNIKKYLSASGVEHVTPDTPKRASGNSPPSWAKR